MTKISPYTLVNNRPNSNNFQIRSIQTRREWIGQKTISRYCPFNLCPRWFCLSSKNISNQWARSMLNPTLIHTQAKDFFFSALNIQYACDANKLFRTYNILCKYIYFDHRHLLRPVSLELTICFKLSFRLCFYITCIDKKLLYELHDLQSKTMPKLNVRMYCDNNHRCLC